MGQTSTKCPILVRNLPVHYTYADTLSESCSVKRIDTISSDSFACQNHCQRIVSKIISFTDIECLVGLCGSEDCDSETKHFFIDR